MKPLYALLPAVNSATLGPMIKAGAFTVLVAVVGFGQDCIPYGRSTTVRGTLARVDENGYWQWIALRLDQPICTLAAPNEFGDPAQGVAQLQAVALDGTPLSDRLNRLVGKKAVLTGKLFGAHTGYHRAAVLMDVQSVEPVDAAGETAIRAPAPPSIVIEDVPAYDAVVRAGKRLVIEARESGSGRLLVPADVYVNL
jgi:uncharacterized protein DUF4431